MIEIKCSLRVRYSETDRMNYVYYGNYPTYLEVGRTELLRKLGTTYREIEEMGIWLPVLNLHIDYKTPARYDDLLEITARVTSLPRVRIHFEYEIHNQKKELILTAQTDLFFFDPSRQRPIPCPNDILSLFQPYFD